MTPARGIRSAKTCHYSAGTDPRDTQGVKTLRKLKYVVVACMAAAIAAATLASGSAGAQTGSSGAGAKKTLYFMGGFTTKGEEAIAQPQFDDGVKLAVKDLQNMGWTVTYDRIPAMGTNAASTEQAFLQALAKHPDAYLSLTSSNTFIPVGPKVAATDMPTFALSAPTEACATGRPVETTSTSSGR